MAELPESEWLFYVVLVIYCIVLVINTVLCMIGLYFQQKHGKQLTNNVLVCLAWGSMLSYNACVLLQLIGVFFYHTNSLSNAFYGTGNLFIYLLFIFRVKITFNYTIYQLKTYLYTISFILVFINWFIYILATITQFMYSLNIKKLNISDTHFGISYLIQSMIGIVFDIMLLVSFVWIFIHKLLEATTQIMISDYQSLSHDDYNLDYDFTLTFSQQKTINTIVKSFILSFIAIMSAQIATFLWLMYDTYYIFYQYDYKSFQSNNVYYIFIIIYTLDTTVNTFCVLLQFKFMENIYQIICPQCHGCVYSICIKCARRKVYQHITEKSALNTCSTIEALYL